MFRLDDASGYHTQQATNLFNDGPGLPIDLGRR
jgi:hypothetical protein